MPQYSDKFKSTGQSAPAQQLLLPPQIVQVDGTHERKREIKLGSCMLDSIRKISNS